jgi:hypothetical protein
MTPAATIFNWRRCCSNAERGVFALNEKKVPKEQPLQVIISHVSVLVEDVRQAATPFKSAGYESGPYETFAAEGTEEIYIGPQDADALLLLQAPIGPGPYLKAYQKRGAGLHHIALDVENVLAFARKMGDIGWLLHPISLQNYQHKTAVFFARPGVHVLLEVNEKPRAPKPRFISQVNVPVAKGHEKYIQDLAIPGLQIAQDGIFSLRIQEHTWTADVFQ